MHVSFFKIKIVFLVMVLFSSFQLVEASSGVVSKTKHVVVSPQKKAVVKRAPLPKKTISSTKKTTVSPVLPPQIRSSPSAAVFGVSTTLNTLTVAGIVAATNQARVANGVQNALHENAVLDAVAAARLEDMFKGQYFEHVSPSGVAPSDVATRFQYQYALFGENIALGEYAGDQALVTAWMNSPHHRENILQKKFIEIGVAARKGVFKGRETWLAVQVFALPLRACPQPDSALKSELEKNTSTRRAIADQAQELLLQIKKDEPRSSEEVAAHNRKVVTYNEYVATLTEMGDKIKKITAEYNEQVRIFNACSKG